MPLKIIFMGTPNFSVPILKSIHNSQHEVIGIYTQSPKKKPWAKNKYFSCSRICTN